MKDMDVGNTVVIFYLFSYKSGKPVMTVDEVVAALAVENKFFQISGKLREEIVEIFPVHRTLGSTS
jgi:hypothetical protein